MITTPTVLILGAGASAHLGYPLGQGLINEICNCCLTNRIPTEISNTYSQSMLSEFRIHLSRSGYLSVDAFLEKHPNYNDLGKLLITHCLKQHENEDRLFPPHNPGWYQYLFQALIVNSPEDLSSIPLTIITFNYDRSLEVFLHQSLIHRYDLEANKALQHLQKLMIIHPHGIMGKYPEIPYMATLDNIPLSKISSNILILHELNEGIEKFCSPAYEEAYNALQKSQKIYFLGFGFHDENIRRFKFFSKESLEGKEVLATHQMHSKEREIFLNRISKYGFLPNQFPPGRLDCDLFFRVHGTLD